MAGAAAAVVAAAAAVGVEEDLAEAGLQAEEDLAAAPVRVGACPVAACDPVAAVDSILDLADQVVHQAADLIDPAPCPVLGQRSAADQALDQISVVRDQALDPVVLDLVVVAPRSGHDRTLVDQGRAVVPALVVRDLGDGRESDNLVWAIDRE